MFRAKLRVHCIIKTIQPTHTQSPRTLPLPLMPMPLIVGWMVVLEIRIIYVTITLSAQTVRFYPRAALVVMATSGLPLPSFVAVSRVCVYNIEASSITAVPPLLLPGEPFHYIIIICCLGYSDSWCLSCHSWWSNSFCRGSCAASPLSVFCSLYGYGTKSNGV